MWKYVDFLLYVTHEQLHRVSLPVLVYCMKHRYQQSTDINLHQERSGLQLKPPQALKSVIILTYQGHRRELSVMPLSARRGRQSKPAAQKAEFAVQIRHQR